MGAQALEVNPRICLSVEGITLGRVIANELGSLLLRLLQCRISLRKMYQR